MQMNISMPPQMARFIRGRVKAGEYTNVSEAIRDAIRHMQQSASDDIEARLTPKERQAIRVQVQQGVRDLEEGRYEEFDEAGLRNYFDGLMAKGKRGARRNIRK